MSRFIFRGTLSTQEGMRASQSQLPLAAFWRATALSSQSWVTVRRFASCQREWISVGRYLRKLQWGYEGNQFFIEAVQHDCTIEAYFEIGEGGDGGNTGGGDDTNVTDPEPPKGPEEMFGALLGTVVDQISQKADGTGMSPPDAATRDADVATDYERSPHPIPAVTPASFGFMMLLMMLVGYFRLRVMRGERCPR